MVAINQIAIELAKLHVILPVERFVAVALAFTGFKEEKGNKGQVVERFLKGTGLSGGYAWCAAFVHHVGYWSQYDDALRKSKWPLPATAGCKELGEFARKKGILLAIPERGDVFLKYSARIDGGRFNHTGIVLLAQQLPDGSFDCVTVEGNTNESGSPEGDTILIRERFLNPKAGDRFVRWRDLL